MKNVIVDTDTILTGGQGVLKGWQGNQTWISVSLMPGKEVCMNRPTVVNLTDILKNSRISLHAYTCQAFVDKKEVNLTITEFNLLACLLKNKGTTLSRDDLLSAVWRESYQGTERTVDTHIQRLRSKLGKAWYLIRTVRGVGYRLES